jgi:hypothetical protein
MHARRLGGKPRLTSSAFCSRRRWTIAIGEAVSSRANAGTDGEPNMIVMSAAWRSTYPHDVAVRVRAALWLLSRFGVLCFALRWSSLEHVCRLSHAR